MQKLTVTELSKAISMLLDEALGMVTVVGEVSNFKEHSSGHRYFTLKDDSSQISCVFWKYRQLNFRLVDGMKVVVKGAVTVYPPRGQYQLDCVSILPLGQGDLYLAFEELKRKLEAQGLFDSARKREIPNIITAVGVATSPTGAAVRDIISTIERRFPICKIYFRPTLVQGNGAEEDITKAIIELNEFPVQAIIVGRGGGSLEDLWCFNTEPVAIAIANSKIPIISAVGHETDFTIADFVADLRAATPTAAAEIVTRTTLDAFLDYNNDNQRTMTKKMLEKIDYFRDSINNQLQSYAIRSISDKIGVLSKFIDEKSIEIRKVIERRLAQLKERLFLNNARLMSLHPLQPLEKGFALLKTEEGVITNSMSLKNINQVEVIRKTEEIKIKYEVIE